MGHKRSPMAIPGKEYSDRYDSDRLRAIPPYVFEQCARSYMKLAEFDNQNMRVSRYLDAWEQYEECMKF